MTALSIQKLLKTFQAVTALKSIDLEIGQGEFVSLLGPSGCGKTTTLRCIAGFDHPDAGSIRFAGRDITPLPPEARNIGMVFQSYALFPHMTVAEILSFGLEMRKIPRPERETRIAAILDMVQLADKAARYPRQLSGGQQQRVALARAVVIEPDLLLLDEPLANLDAVLRDEMRFFIRSLQQRIGITAVYVTHDQSEAMAMSDRIAVMFDGEVAQYGTPREIYTEPASRRVASFIGKSSFVEGKVSAADGGRQIRVETRNGPVVGRGREPFAIGANVSVLMRPEAVEVVDAADGGIGRLPGTIARTVYLGDSLDLFVRLDDGSEIEVVARPDIERRVGDRVGIVVPPGQPWIVAE